MSFYATIQGQIKYRSQSDLDRVVGSLTEKGWMKDNKFVDEMGYIVNEESSSDVDGLTLNIPLSTYRNLSRQLQGMVAGCESAEVRWSSTDGCFQGGVFEGEKETIYELAQWAKDNLEPENQNPPAQGNGEEEDFEDYCQWMADVELEFHSDI